MDGCSSGGRRPLRLLISGYFGFNNAGDEAILTSMVSSLRRFLEPVEITVISGNPAQTAAQHRVRAVARTNFWGIISSLRRADLLISGGGSILQDVTSSRSLLYYLGVVFLGKILGLKVMFFGQGVGPIRRSFNRVLTGLVANRVDLITVREEASRKTLLELGVRRPKIHVTADQVFCLEPASTERAREILTGEGVEGGRPLVGISLRPWRNQGRYKEAVARAADWVAENMGAQIVFLPLQSHVDLPVAREVADLMQSQATVLSGNYTAQELMGIIGEMALVIGMRLHALIFAAAQGVPMVGLVYDPKVEDFLKMVDQPAAGRVKDISAEELVDCVERVWGERDQIRTCLAQKGQGLVQLALENSRLVADLLGR